MTDKYVIRLQGKEYKLVAGRVIDFRRAHPNGAITTELLHAADGEYVFRATVTDGEGRVLAIAHGSASAKAVRHPVTPLEKAETKAVGRALGLAGFGTDDINDDADGESLADSPVPVAGADPFSAPKDDPLSLEYYLDVSSPQPPAPKQEAVEARLMRFRKHMSKSTGRPVLCADFVIGETGETGVCYLRNRKADEFGMPVQVRDSILAGAVYSPARPVVVTLRKEGNFWNLVDVLEISDEWNQEEGQS